MVLRPWGVETNVWFNHSVDKVIWTLTFSAFALRQTDSLRGTANARNESTLLINPNIDIIQFRLKAKPIQQKGTNMHSFLLCSLVLAIQKNFITGKSKVF